MTTALGLISWALVGAAVFVAIYAPFWIVRRIRSARRGSIRPAIFRREAEPLPLRGARVRTTVIVDGEEVEAVGTLAAYGFVADGKGILKYLIDAEVAGEKIDHLVDVRGEGVATWITSQDVTEPDEWMHRLGLTSPKFDELRIFGMDKTPAWRR